jgi:chromosome segregation ATPase
MLLLIDNSSEIYQFTIVIIFITAIIFFVGMYWYSISLQKSIREQEQTKQSLLLSSHELANAQLQNQVLEAEKKAREEKTLRLQQEITLKNNELVTSTLMLNQQKKFMEEVSQVIKDIEAESSPSKSQLRKLSRLIKSNLSIDKNWETFRKQFDHVHPNFVKKIERLFPKLTQNDLRHCAYIRMRLSTKEIAELMNVNPTSVQIARVRLKKKMGLPEEIDLRNYIINFR